MKAFLSLCSLSLLLSSLPLRAGSSQVWAGEFADKNYKNGKAVFQMSIEQNGNDLIVFFSAAHNDGSGAAPEADGKGQIISKGPAEFKWTDSFKNSGTGKIVKAGNDIVVSIKPTHVADSRCMEFYGDNIRLKPAGKK